MSGRVLRRHFSLLSASLLLAACVDIESAEAPAAHDLARWPTIAAGGAIELHFTRPGTTRDDGADPGEDPEVDDALVALIDEATDRIDLSLYEFDRADVLSALERAADRGVAIRFVGDADEVHDAGYEGLTARGLALSLRNPNDRIMHNKFLVVDERVVWTGSMNVSHNGVMRNNNHSLRIESPQLAAMYLAEHAQMHDTHLFGRHKEPLATAGDGVGLGAEDLEPWFSPEDNAHNALLDVLDTADFHVFFAVFSFTRDDIATKLEELHAAGVQVVGIFDESQARGRYSVDERLAASGIPVYIDGNRNYSGFSGGKLHHKLLIVDPFGDPDPATVFGSYNWSKSASHYNDENLIVDRGPELPRAFFEEFCGMLAVATPHPDYLGEVPDPCTTLLRQVRINEILPNPDGADYDHEWVELVNAGPAPLDIGGWTLSDGDRVRHVFAPRVLQSEESVVVAASELTADVPQRVVATTGYLSLANGADEVIVTDSEGVIVDRAAYTSAQSGLSFNRDPDGGIAGDFVLHDQLHASTNSPGTRVDGSGWLPPPPPAQVVLNEAMPNPVGTDRGQEWVELVNVGGITADMGGWTLGDAVEPMRHVFPKGAALDPGEVMVLWDTGSHGTDPTASTTQLSLNNTGDVITLRDAAGTLISSVSWTSTREGESQNREPDGDPGAVVIGHSEVPGAVGSQSPGTRADGSGWGVAR